MTNSEIPLDSRHLVDPELILLLERPSVEVNASTLPVLREPMGALRITAPEALEVKCEERFIEGDDGQRIRLLVYLPRATPRTGGLLSVHGGSFVMCTPEMHDAQSRYLAQRAGCVVVAVDYRLAPEWPFPAGLMDCYAALRWMHTEAMSLGVSRDRLGVFGDSSGGGLAAGLALMVRDRGELSLAAQFLLYPMLDDRTGTPAELKPMPYTGEFIWTRQSNQFCWQAFLRKYAVNGDVPIYAAPGRAEVLSGLPPTFIGVGALDLFLSEDLQFAQRLLRDGVPTELHVYPGAFHAFTTADDKSSVSLQSRRDLWDAIARFYA